MKPSDGATVLVIGLGDLGGRIFSALTQSRKVERLVGAGRSKVGQALAAQAALSAVLLEGPRHVSFERLDLREHEATIRLLTSLQPEITIMAASRHTWWMSRTEDPERNPGLARLPYGAWLPLHLVPVRQLMEARRASGTRGTVVCLPFPDVVGPALAPLGLQPQIGAGNVTEVAAKLRLLASAAYDAPVEEVGVRLVMHHAAERYAFEAFSSLAGEQASSEMPPWYAEVQVKASKVCPGHVDDFFHQPYPLLPGRESHGLTAAATVHLVEALLGDRKVQTHAPAPHGLPGGYPVLVSRQGVNLGLLADLPLDDAIELNRQAARWDGIERILADGTVEFTPSVARATEDVLGFRLERVSPADHESVADEMERRAGTV